MKSTLIALSAALFLSCMCIGASRKAPTHKLSGTFTVEESNTPEKSKHPQWWLSSGAYFIVNNGVGMTMQGKLRENDPWYIRYSEEKEESRMDTDKGALPQNVFRLVSRTAWQNVTTECSFRINEVNMTDSTNRNASNAFLFFLRYKDQHNLYYAGIRVDGTVIIKKKIGKEYFTLGEEKVFKGKYDRQTMPCLIPTEAWMGLRATCTNQKDGSVKITVKVDKKDGKGFIEVLSATDKDGKSGNPFVNAGSVGIRTDFMDVEFKDYSITEH